MITSRILESLTVNMTHDFATLFDTTASAVSDTREFCAGFDFEMKVSSATGEITIDIDSASFDVVKQTSTRAHFDIDPAVDKEFHMKHKGVIHRHPQGCNGFSQEDITRLNPYFDMSLVRIPETNIMFGVINLCIEDSAVSVQLELTNANFNIKDDPNGIMYQGKHYSIADYKALIASLVTVKVLPKPKNTHQSRSNSPLKRRLQTSSDRAAQNRSLSNWRKRRNGSSIKPPKPQTSHASLNMNDPSNYPEPTNTVSLNAKRSKMSLTEAEMLALDEEAMLAAEEEAKDFEELAAEGLNADEIADMRAMEIEEAEELEAEYDKLYPQLK